MKDFQCLPGIRYNEIPLYSFCFPLEAGTPALTEQFPLWLFTTTMSCMSGSSLYCCARDLSIIASVPLTLNSSICMKIVSVSNILKVVPWPSTDVFSLQLVNKVSCTFDCDSAIVT